MRFIGWRSREELYTEVYPQLDCLMLFSPSEAGPLVLWEAMLHGVVAVSSRYRGAAAEGTLRDRETALLFEVGDVASASAAVAGLARDSALYAHISDKGRQVAQDRYSLETYNQGWLRAFSRALKVPPVVSQLPAAAFAASGRLERLGLPSWAGSPIRRLLGRQPRAAGPGAEWPHCAVWSPEALSSIDEAVVRLDRATADSSGGAP